MFQADIEGGAPGVEDLDPTEFTDEELQFMENGMPWAPEPEPFEDFIEIEAQAQKIETPPSITAAQFTEFAFRMPRADGTRAWQLAAVCDEVSACVAAHWMCTRDGLLRPGEHTLVGQSAFSMAHPGLAADERRAAGAVDRLLGVRAPPAAQAIVHRADVMVREVEAVALWGYPLEDVPWDRAVLGDMSRWLGRVAAYQERGRPGLIREWTERLGSALAQVGAPWYQEGT